MKKINFAADCLMTQIADRIQHFRRELGDKARLVAVSKNFPATDISEAYDAGQRIFGENRVQELISKQPLLPSDIEWHLIGHLQTNKVKYIASFVAMIHSIDSLKLLLEVNREAARHNRQIDCLLQFHIANEETKFGLSEEEGMSLIGSEEFNALQNVRICGVMGMATFTEDQDQVRKEFRHLRQIFEKLKSLYFSGKPEFSEISMGMSDDYQIALEEGSTLVRIGSAIFGSRS